jgi:hypothetical protein
MVSGDLSVSRDHFFIHNQLVGKHMIKKIIAITAMILSITTQVTTATERTCDELLALKEYYKGSKSAKESVTQNLFACLKCKNDLATFKKAIEYAKQRQVTYLNALLDLDDDLTQNLNPFATKWGRVAATLEEQSAHLEKEEKPSTTPKE